MVSGFTPCVVAVSWWVRHYSMQSGWDEKYCATLFRSAGEEPQSLGIGFWGFLRILGVACLHLAGRSVIIEW